MMALILLKAILYLHGIISDLHGMLALCYVITQLLVFTMYLGEKEKEEHMGTYRNVQNILLNALHSLVFCLLVSEL